MTGVGNHWHVIPHFHQAHLDQRAQMIRIEREHGPLRLYIAKRPTEVDSSDGIDAGKFVHNERLRCDTKQRKPLAFRIGRRP
jgi:hypothetical protein